MLVLCNGMIRSGSTLQYNLTRSLVEDLGLGRGEGWLANDGRKAARWRLQRWAASRCWHVIKTHRLPACTSELIARHEVRICYIHRDLRDVAVSAKRKWGYRDEPLYTALAEAVAGYEAVQYFAPVLCQRYEEVIGDLPLAVNQIAELLRLRVPAATANEIAAEQSIERAKARSRALAGSGWFRARSAACRVGRHLGLGRVARVLTACGLPLGRVRTLLKTWDRRTLEHADHISSHRGAIGQWQDELTVDECRKITARFGGWLELANYTAPQCTSGDGRTHVRGTLCAR